MFDDSDIKLDNQSLIGFMDSLHKSVEIVLKVEPDSDQFIDRFVAIERSGGFQIFSCLYGGVSGEQEVPESLIRTFAIQLWNSTPLPSNYYQPSPIPKPGRNESCWCHSGKKFKHCCAKECVDGGGVIDQKTMMCLVLDTLGSSELGRVWQHVPSSMLAKIAAGWIDRGSRMLKRAQIMIEPIFKQDNAKLNGQDVLALNALRQIYHELGEKKRAEQLSIRLMDHPDKALQSYCYQQKAAQYFDAGQKKEAWEYFHHALRLDPDSPWLAPLELIMLQESGQLELSKQRGTFWLKLLNRKNRNGDLDEIIGIVESILVDEPKESGLEEVINDFGRWLIQIMEQSLPPVEKVVVRSGTSIIEPISRKEKKLIQQWNSVWDNESAWNDPLEWMRLLKDNPRLLNSFTVLFNLVESIDKLSINEPEEIKFSLIALASKALPMVLPVFPDAPFDWEFRENRPALWLMETLSLTMVETNNDDNAIKMMTWLLRLNADDNIGIRSILMNAYLRTGRDKEAVLLGECYVDDFLVDMQFGYALALFRQSKKEQADKVLASAIQDREKTAKALLSRHMKRPKSINPNTIRLGGDDEAWEYRQVARKLWLDTPGAMAWLKSK